MSAVDGTFIDFNEAFLEHTGYSRGDVIGKTSESLRIFADKETGKQMKEALRKNNSIFGKEIACRKKSGEVRTCLFTSGVLMMEGKTHILSTVEDITARKSTEEALQTMVRSMVGTTGLDFLTKITENLSSWLGADCVMIGELQPDGKTVRVLSMRLDGKTAPDFSYPLQGTPCGNAAENGFCLYPDNVRTLFPEAKALADLNIRGYVGTSLKNTGGEVIGILCALSRSTIPPVPAMKEIIDIIVVKAFAEVERAGIERTLRESEEKFRTLVEHSLDGIQILDLAGKILFMNRAAAKLFDLGEAPGDFQKNALEFVAPVSRESVQHDFNEIAKGIGSYPVNYQAVTTTGRKIWVEGVGKRIGFRNLPAILISLRDITSRKRMEDAILRTNKQLNILSSITRHDVLNKVAIIQGHIAYTKQKGPEADCPALLEKIDTTARIIISQLEFTRIYQNLRTKEPEWQMLKKMFYSMHIPDSITLQNELGTEEIFADRMLEKVFLNLIDNTLRHGRRVTGIRVESHPGPDDLTIMYSDDGIGIPAEEKEMIFERGYGKNTGLGLFLAREILNITGITIRETGEPGKGARFEIHVPNGSFRART